jgi:hypothetical protein
MLSKGNPSMFAAEKKVAQLNGGQCLGGTGFDLDISVQTANAKGHGVKNHQMSLTLIRSGEAGHTSFGWHLAHVEHYTS